MLAMRLKIFLHDWLNQIFRVSGVPSHFLQFWVKIGNVIVDNKTLVPITELQIRLVAQWKWCITEVYELQKTYKNKRVRKMLEVTSLIAHIAPLALNTQITWPFEPAINKKKNHLYWYYFTKHSIQIDSIIKSKNPILIRSD